jgi:uncharacterized protein
VTVQPPVEVVRLAWAGDGSPRIEVAHVQRRGDRLTATGTQLGPVYELRYRLTPDRLALEIVGGPSRQVELEEADFFDVGWSPLFNSLPVLRDGLLNPGLPRSYVMTWVDVPSLELSRSEQTYEPQGNGLVRFRSGEFIADIRFDEAGYVLDYPGMAKRLFE